MLLSHVTMQRLCLLVMLVTIVTSYFTFASGSHYYDLYGVLGEAFLNKRLHLDRVYFDTAYFGDRSYLYFGPVPALLIYIPIKLLTGIAVTEDFIVPLQNSIGTICLSLLVYQAASRTRPINILGLACVVLSIGFGSWILFNCRTAHVYSAAIAGGYCFSAMGLLFLWWFLNNQQKKYWAVLASLCLGLAIGSRITYVGNCIVLLIACWMIVRHQKEYFKRFGDVVRLLLPCGICCIAIGIYNYERFGNPLENGGAYVNHSYDSDMYYRIMIDTLPTPEHLLPCTSCTRGYFNWRNIPYNSYYYLLSPLQYNKGHVGWRNLFAPHTMYVPPSVDNFLVSKGFGIGGSEYTFGLLIHYPFSLWFFIALFHRRARREWQATIRTIMAGIEAMAISTLFWILSYYWHALRYEQDFGPWMMAAGGIYYMQLLAHVKRKRVLLLLLIIGGAMTLYGSFIGAIYGFCGHGRC